MATINEEAQGDEVEGLVPRNPTVLGLKVADEDEAATVRKLVFAAAALVGIAVLHFFFNTLHGQPFSHSFLHLVVSTFFPLAGYQGVKRRSALLTWLFHVTAVLSALSYIVLFFVVVGELVKIEAMGASTDCAGMAQPCPKFVAESTAPGDFDSNGGIWRCSGGFCIDSGKYCDGTIDCYDGSDEWYCQADPHYEGEHHVLDEGVTTMDEYYEQQEHCLDLLEERKRFEGHGRGLRWWWVFTIVPVNCLFFYSAYHSLEFYVQMRLSRLGVRVHGQSATVFEQDRGALLEAAAAE